MGCIRDLWQWIENGQKRRLGDWERGRLGDGKERTSNIERSTSNGEWEKIKKQQKRPYLIIGATSNLRSDNLMASGSFTELPLTVP
jgi:hypothetical protein